MRASFGSHESVGIASGEGELCGHDACLGACGDVVEFEVETFALCPPAIHPQQNFTPVLSVDTSIFGVDLHNAVELVVFAGEQTANSKLAE